MTVNYRTGAVLAYVGSAGYYRNDVTTPQFQPKFDVLSDGWRQPGSAFKPFNYVTGINDGTIQFGFSANSSGNDTQAGNNAVTVALAPSLTRPSTASTASSASCAASCAESRSPRIRAVTA